jgi:hypothetical protein
VRRGRFRPPRSPASPTPTGSSSNASASPVHWKGETALAQIYGLRIPIGELDDAVLARLRVLAPLLKAGFNPDEPRIPKGEPGAGQWTNGGENASTAETAVAEQDRKSICIEQCAHLLERPLPYRWSNLNTFAFHRCVNDCMRGAE